MLLKKGEGRRLGLLAENKAEGEVWGWDFFCSGWRALGVCKLCKLGSQELCPQGCFIGDGLLPHLRLLNPGTPRAICGFQKFPPLVHGTCPWCCLARQTVRELASQDWWEPKGHDLLPNPGSGCSS